MVQTHVKTTPSTVPAHIAIIMDGNRRWARKHGLEILQGHQKVAREMIEKIVTHAANKGVQYVTLWAFSTENWQRSRDEVTGLMSLFREAFGERAEKLHQLGVRLNVVGDLQQFPEDIQAGVEKWLQATAENTRITVTLALGYGGRDEIVRAVKRLVADGVEIDNITEAAIGGRLDTAQLPDPDLIIRAGGEQRLSGFLPWQSVYAELYFTPTLMPDFDEAELDKALADFAERSRRFGK